MVNGISEKEHKMKVVNIPRRTSEKVLDHMEKSRRYYCSYKN